MTIEEQAIAIYDSLNEENKRKALEYLRKIVGKHKESDAHGE